MVKRLRTFFKGTYLGLILLFLYAPILILILFGGCGCENNGCGCNSGCNNGCGNGCGCC